MLRLDDSDSDFITPIPFTDEEDNVHCHRDIPEQAELHVVESVSLQFKHSEYTYEAYKSVPK